MYACRKSLGGISVDGCPSFVLEGDITARNNEAVEGEGRGTCYS